MLNEKIIASAIEYFKKNETEFNACIEDLDSYNGYLGDDRYYEMDMLPELFSGGNVIDLLNMAYFGYDADDSKESSFNPNRDYFTFNGYGNLVSSDSKDYSAFLDNWFIESLYENADEIYSLPDEIKELFETAAE